MAGPSQKPRFAYSPHAIGAGFVIVAFALQYVFRPWLGVTTWMLLYPTLFMISWLLGFWPGVWSNALASGIAAFFLLPPDLSFAISNPEDTNRLITFTLSCFLINILVEFRRRAVKALAKSEKHFRLLADSMPQLVWVTSETGGIEYINQRWFQYTGQKSNRKLSKQSWIDAIHPEDKDRVFTAHNKAIEAKGHFEAEYRLLRHDGVYRWHFARTVFAGDTGGAAKRFGTATDIHERKLAQEQAEEAIKRLRFITDRLPSFVSYLDSDRRYQFVNHTFEKWFGIPREQILGKTREELLENELVYHLVRPYEDRAFEGDNITFPIKIEKADGEYRYLDVDFRPDFGSDKKVRGVLSVSHNVTERELAKEALQGLVKQAQDAVKSRDEFLSIASHELRTPITGMKLHTQLMQRQLIRENPAVFSRESVIKFVDRTDRGLDRMARLVEDMLDITRIQAGKLSLYREVGNVVDVVKETIERFSSQLVAAGISTELDAPETVTASVDKFRMEQVVTNLITNAIRYAPRAPVQVKIREEDGKAVIVFADSGPGISEENRERVFERFERLVSPDQISGLGLGLYIVREIVRAHGGTISVVSPKTRGAQFVIKLPTSEVSV